MKKFKNGLALLLLSGIISSLISGCTIEVPEDTTSESTEETSIVVDFGNIRAQDDFYGYVNAEYLSDIDVLYYQQDAGAFGSVNSNLQELMQNRITEIATSTEEYEYGSKEQRIRDIYNQYIEYYSDDSVRSQNRLEIESVIAEIMDASDIDSLLNTMFYIQNNYGACYDIINLAVQPSDLDPNNYCIAVSFINNVGGVELTDIDEWNNSVSNLEDPVSDYLTVAGVDEETADEYARELAGLALDITWSSNIDLFNASSYYEFEEIVTSEELETIFTNIDYRMIEQAKGINSNPYGGWLTYDKGQLSAVNELFVEENLNALKAWMVYSVVKSYGDLLVDDYPILEQYYSESLENLELRAVGFISYGGYLDDEISAVYVEEAYTEEMDIELRSMCEDIRDGYRNVINNATWLSEETRSGLIRKLDNIVFLTGSDVDTDAIDVERSDSMGENLWDTMRGLDAYDNFINLSHIGQDFDRLVPGMSMAMVNACYQPNNTVTITVAIMASPFFDTNSDYYTNLGGLGAVIAHEIGHGFDSNCIDFDENGAYNPGWISDEDRDALEARNQEAINYFETTFAVFDIYYVDGEQTLGENYADLGGMEVITSICDTNEDLQTMFTNYATIWCSLETTDGIVQQLDSDVHSPSYIRVNSILATLDAYYEAYGVEEGDDMYVAPENRIGRWN